MSICPFYSYCQYIPAPQLRGAINLQSFPLRKYVAMPQRKDTESNQRSTSQNTSIKTQSNKECCTIPLGFKVGRFNHQKCLSMPRNDRGKFKKLFRVRFWLKKEDSSQHRNPTFLSFRPLS
jgi:hypothetical protein